MTDEVKISKMKGFLDAVKAYYGFIAMLLAIGSVIYASGVKRERVDNSNAVIVSKVNKLIISDSARAIKQDTILARIHYIREGQVAIRTDMTTVTNVVRNLSSDFLNHVSKDNNVSKQDIINIMQGLQFSVESQSTNKSTATPQFNIKVIPIKK